MPVVGISLDILRRLVGQPLPAEELQRTLERMGCDVEGIQEVARWSCRRCGAIQELLPGEELPPQCPDCGNDLRGEEGAEELGRRELLRMELLAVRPDLFDPGGLARALRGYLGIEVGLPQLEVGEGNLELRVEPIVTSPEASRPWIVAAVLEDVSLDEETIRVLMKLQENLHWALGRNRRRASIGVYDLDRLQPPITYTAKDPDSFRFRPLGVAEGESWPLRRILREHPKGTAFRHLLEGLRAYPILVDAAGQVLSMPPIINSEETRVTRESRRLFVDVTGLSEHSVRKALAILVSNLAELVPGMRIRSVRVHRPDGTTWVTPELEAERHHLRPAEAARLLGLELQVAEVVSLLRRMRHEATETGDGTLEVRVPAYRSDILHEVDLVEDVAIAYGYDRIPQVLLPTTTLPQERPVEALSRRAREVLAGLGLLEVLTLVLTNPEDHDAVLGRREDPRAVRIANPISGEQTMVRTEILPGLLQILRQNRHRPLPQRIFEVGDVTLLDEGSETGAREERRLAFAVVHPHAGFAEAKALAEAVAREFQTSWELEPWPRRPFLEGRAALARERGRGRPLMWFGEIHPEVLEKLGITNPVIAAEGPLLALAGRDPLEQDAWRGD
jgi:phenylalanyl-tRNA synthetase beta chain